MPFLDDSNIQKLAERITEAYYKKDKDAKRWGKHGWEQTIYDTKWTLRRLETSIYLKNPKIFFDYLDWLVIVLTSRNVSFGIIFDHTEICLDILKKESKKTKSATKYVKLLEKGLEHLRNNAPPPPNLKI
jgi:hypothetical protein